MQIDTRNVAAEFADREMKKLHASAAKMLADAASALQPEDFDVAIERATELFDNAPWLSSSDANVPGCLHLTYDSLFALLVIAKDHQSNS